MQETDKKDNHSKSVTEGSTGELARLKGRPMTDPEVTREGCPENLAFEFSKESTGLCRGKGPCPGVHDHSNSTMHSMHYRMHYRKSLGRGQGELRDADSELRRCALPFAPCPLL